MIGGQTFGHVIVISLDQIHVVLSGGPVSGFKMVIVGNLSGNWMAKKCEIASLAVGEECVNAQILMAHDDINFFPFRDMHLCEGLKIAVGSIVDLLMSIEPPRRKSRIWARGMACMVEIEMILVRKGE